jgi:alpha/beta superfamily hydrolase
VPGPVGRTTVVELVHFQAGPYCLEGELAYPEDTAPCGCAVLAGSHPLLGGNMHNNVVRSLGDGLAERGLATLRFNYRGVGGSEGPALDVARHMAEFWETSHVTGETDHAQDVQGAVEFLREAVGHSTPLALVGYSFGCSLLPQVQPAGEPPALVLLAPTPARHDYTTFLSVRAPVLVVASEDDFATDAAVLRRWFDGVQAPKRLELGRFDNHFFRGHEAWLVETVSNFLASCWG